MSFIEFLLLPDIFSYLDGIKLYIHLFNILNELQKITQTLFE